MDISKLLQDGRVYLRKKFDEVHVYDSCTNEELLVYAVRNGAHVTFDKVLDATTNKIIWKDPLGAPVAALIDTSTVQYSEDVIALLLERMTDGMSLTGICRLPDMPKYSQLVRWMKYHPWIRQALEDARMARAEHHRDKVMEEAERAESSKDPIEATKVKIQAHQWLAGVDDARYSSKNKIEANINMPTQIIVQTNVPRGQIESERVINGKIESIAPKPTEHFIEDKDE